MPSKQFPALLALAALAAASIVLPPDTRAGTYYVATTGDDAASGALASPWRTIGYGLGKLTPGDTLYVREGTYAEAVGPGGIPSGTSWDAPITVASYPGETATVRPAVFGGGFAFNIVSSHYLVFDRLVVDASNVNYGFFIVNSAIAGTVDHIRVQNSEVKNSLWLGIYVGPNSGYNEFLRLHVHDNPNSHGFYIDGSNNLVEGCDIHDNGKYGVQVYDGYSDSQANDNVVRFNKIYHNCRNPALLNCAALCLTSGSRNTAYNNLIWGNGGGVILDFGSVGARVYNNTIFDNNARSSSRIGIYLGTGGGTSGTSSSGADVRNNIVYQHADGNISNAGQPGTTLSNNLTVDPLFVDAAGALFQLRAGSPAIDQGTNLSANGVTVDFDGHARPAGPAFDIGAYEYAPASAPTPPIIPVPAPSPIAPAPPTAGRQQQSRAPQRFLSPALADGINDRAVFGPRAREVAIYDILGREVFRASREGGSPIAWDGRDVSGRLVGSGVYIARIVKDDLQTEYQSFAVVK